MSPEHQQLAQRLARHLGLAFIAEPDDTNICFANDPSLRPEFRQSFTEEDLMNYLYALTTAQPTNTAYLPADTAEFWHLVALGKK